MLYFCGNKAPINRDRVMLLQAIMTEVCDTLESLECISVVVYMSACCCRRADRTAGSAVPTVEHPRRSPRLKLAYSTVKKTCYSLQNFTPQINNSFLGQLRNNCSHQKRSVNTKCTTNRYRPDANRYLLLGINSKYDVRPDPIGSLQAVLSSAPSDLVTRL